MSLRNRNERGVMMATCKNCGGALPGSTGGRPPVYCSVHCRRAIEFRRRAWDHQAAWLAEDGFLAVLARGDASKPAAERHYQRMYDEAKADFAKRGPRP